MIPTDPPSVFDPSDPKNRPLKIFLCHSSADKNAVYRLDEHLRTDGTKPWLDEKDLLPGQDWSAEITKAVRASDVVLVCLSKMATNNAGYLHKEIREALDVADRQPEGSIFLIPIRLEEVEVPERLRRWQWVNLFEDSGYEKLIRALRVRAESLGITMRPRSGPFIYNDPATMNLYGVERDAIMRALTFTKGDRTVAAALLGIGRTTLYRKLKEYGL